MQLNQTIFSIVLFFETKKKSATQIQTKQQTKKSMKKLILFFTTILFSTITFAQESKHEVNLGVGFITTNSAINTLSDFLTTGLSGGYYTSKNKSFTGAYQGGYKYALTKRFSLGGTFAYEEITSDAFLNNTKEGRFKNQYYTLAPEIDFKYITSDIITVYSLFGIGGTYTSRSLTSETNEKTDDSTVYFNFQATPVGIKVGKSFGVYGELGFGYKGLLNISAFARF